MALFCVPIRAEKINDLKILIKKAGEKADIIEIWLDALNERPEPYELLKFAKKPIIIVNKGKKERGGFKGSEQKRMEILEKFLKAGIAYVDVSINTKPGLLRHLFKSRKKGTGIILSFHDFKKTPTLKTLKKIRDKAFRLGADFVKIATFANTNADNLTIFNLLADSVAQGKPCIALCMGKYGRISRMLAPAFGSYIIYAALDEMHRTAPGQLTLAEYKKISSLLKS